MNSSEFHKLIHLLGIEIEKNNRSVANQTFIKLGLQKLALYKHKEFIYEQLITLCSLVQASIQLTLLLLTLIALLIASLLAIQLTLEVLYTLPPFQPVRARRRPRE